MLTLRSQRLKKENKISSCPKKKGVGFLLPFLENKHHIRGRRKKASVRVTLYRSRALGKRKKLKTIMQGQKRGKKGSAVLLSVVATARNETLWSTYGSPGEKKKKGTPP